MQESFSTTLLVMSTFFIPLYEPGSCADFCELTDSSRIKHTNAVYVNEYNVLSFEWFFIDYLNSAMKKQGDEAFDAKESGAVNAQQKLDMQACPSGSDE